MTVRVEVQATLVYEVPDEVIWPNGGAKNATTARAELLEDMNGITTVGWMALELFPDWPPTKTTLVTATAVEVDIPNPAYTGDDVLFGDPPPATVVDRRRL